MGEIRFSKLSIVTADAILAEKVSSHFRRPGIYLPLFETPKGWFPDFGYFVNECVRISNAINALQSTHVLCLGCEADLVSQLKKRLTTKNLISLGSFDKNEISKIPGFREVSSYEPPKKPGLGSHMVVVEDGNELSKVIGRNLAAHENGSVIVIPEVTDEEVDEIRESLRIWSSGNALDRDHAKDTVLKLIQKQLANLSLDRVGSISFITRGLPYGIYPFKFPVTHFFSLPNLGLSVLKGMMKSKHRYLRCPVAFLCDPGSFGDAEFKNLAQIFDGAGYLVRTSFGANAKVRTAEYISGYFPLDFIFYSTHCGEIKGRRIKEVFTTSDEKEHIIIYDSAVGFAPKPDTDLIKVQNYMRFVSLDNVSWADREGKKRIGTSKILNEYIKKKNGDKAGIKVLEISDVGVVKGCDGLQMSDSVFLPALHELGGHKYPIVFNNACSSWRELGVRFVYAGASIYIGTSVDVSNSLAIDVATRFASDLVKGKTVGHSLYKAQIGFITDMGYSPYLMHGYLFTKCVGLQPANDNPKVFLRELTKAVKMWKKREVESQIEEVKINSEDVAGFLQEELRDLTE